MDTQKYCSGCNKPLAASAPQGLCPECLLKAGLGSGADIGPETQAGRAKTPFTPPPPGELARYFPQLEILEFIAQGGMGAVYKARQKQLDRVVALKILPPQAVSGPGFAERFTREARALAKLNHPHIVTLYEFGQSDGLYFFLMEFVDGINLQQLLNAGTIAPNEALAIVPQICDALQYAHQRGIVHRDIKPGNILLSQEGQVKIADFGVAKIMAESVAETAGGQAVEKPGDLTEAGSVLGTPSYMAPEQVAHPLAVDHRADIYSLGVVFYQMLTGELPTGKFEPPSRKVVIDVRLDEVVLRALEKKPELRYQQAGDVKTQVETIVATPGSGAATIPFETESPIDLAPMRWKIILWAAALAAGALEMALNVSPTSCALVIGIMGAGLSAVSATLALIFRDNLRKLYWGKRLVSLNGAGMAAAAIWVASTTRSLNTPWQNTIFAVGVGAIVYSLRCLAGTEEPSAAVQNRPVMNTLRRRLWKLLRVELPAALIIGLVIRTFFLQPFKAETDAAAPEIPRNSRFLVWKPGHSFVLGDIIAYRVKEWISVGRVVRSDQDTVWVNRNGQSEFRVASGDILGKVVSVYWRASENASPVVFLRPSNEDRQSFSGSDIKIEARAMPLGTLMAYAYGLPKFYVHRSEQRVILPAGVADGRYDFQLMPFDYAQKALQIEIKKQLGLAAHREKYETNVLDLIVSKPNVIAQAVAEGGNSSDRGNGPGQFDFANMPIDDLGDYLENTLGQLVINETELTQKFSGTLKWHHQPSKEAELKEIQNALLNQFGLELVPSHQPIEMLVVEKTRPAE